MEEPAIRDQIIEDLGRLGPEEQKRAARLIHGLVSSAPRGVGAQELAAVVGILDDVSALEMSEAIQEECERIDAEDE